MRKIYNKNYSKNLLSLRIIIGFLTKFLNHQEILIWQVGHYKKEEKLLQSTSHVSHM